jgi:hypothetical protein
VPVGATIDYRVVISNSGTTDATGVEFADTLDPNTTQVGGVNVSPLAFNDTYTAVANTQLRVGNPAALSGPAALVAGSVIANDVEFLGDSFIISAFDAASVQGGTVSMVTTGADRGSFSYVPGVGDTGADSFTYTIRDDGLDGIAGNADDLTSVGTVTITVGAQKVWYVDNSYGGANGASDGRSTRPFTSLAPLNVTATDPDGTGDLLFVHSGTGAQYTGGVALEASQTLQGNGNALVVGGFNLVAAGTAPTISNAGVVGVALANGNVLRGFTVGSAATAISGTTFGTLDVLNVTINNPTGAGLALTTGSFASNSAFNSITSAGGTNGIALTGVNGPAGNTIALGGGALSGASGAEFFISGGNAQLTYTGNITNTAGRSVDISTHATGNITLSGTLSDTGTGVSITGNTSGTIAFTNASKVINTGTNAAVTLTGNTGATINFTGGGLDIDTTSGAGFTATGGGTVTVQGSANTVDVASGSGLIVNNTLIGGANLNFQRISVGTGAGSAGVGISLDTTGNTGRLVVSGTGSAGSGGVIQHKTGADQSRTNGIGIYLNSTLNPSFDRMQLNDFDNFAIRGNNVAGFSLTNSVVSGINGTTHVNITGDSYGEGAIYFGNNGGASADTDAGSGTFTFTNNTISGGRARNLSVVDAGTSGGDLRLNVSNVTFGLVQNHQLANTTLALETRGVGTTAHTTVTGSTFAGQPGDAMNFTGQQSTTMHVIVGGAGALANTITNSHGFNNIGGGSMNFSSAGTMFFDARNNTMSGANGSAVTFFKAGSNDGSTPNLQGNFDGNTIGTNGVAGSGSSGSGNGIFISAGGTGLMRFAITNNFINGITGNAFIYADNTGGNYDVDLTLTGNTLHTGGAGVFAGLALTAGGPSTLSDDVDLFAKISGNDFSDSGANSTDIFMYVATTASTITLSGATAANVDTEPHRVTFLQNTNNLNGNGSITTVSAGLDGNATNANWLASAASPPLPTAPTPLLFAPLPSEPGIVDTQPVAPSPIGTPASDDPGPPVLPPVIVDDGILSQAELDSLVAAAITRWEATGLTAEQVSLLHSVTFTIEDLPGWYLGSAGDGVVTLDANAAGNSWFIDATPDDDGEFAGAGTQLFATATGGAAGRIDALSTVLHELGHQLGLDDTYTRADAANLMYGWIHLSERRLPAAGQADGAVPHDHDHGPDFAFATITIGTLPIGKSVTIDFTVTVNDPFGGATAQVSNQGTVSGSNFANVLTDDPNAVGTANPTVTAVDLPDVTVAVSPASVAEDGAPNLVYTFTRQGSTVGPITVNFSFAGGATFSSDYTQTGAATFSGGVGTITIPTGQSSATITIDPSADSTVEPDETAVLTVTTGIGYEVGSPSVATGTIANDDTDVSVAVSPGSVVEDGATNLVYTFTRAGVTTNSLTVNFTVGGTADSSTDYVPTGAATFGATSGTVTFAVNSTTATVIINPSADGAVEPDETVILTLATGTGYNVAAPSSATGTITNDDTDVSVAVAPGSVLEDGAANFVYTFTRSGVTASPLTVNFSVGGGAVFASSGTSDYSQTGAASFTPTAGAVTFAANSTTATVTIDPTADATVEPDETVILTLASGANYNVVAPTAATGTITNDDTDVSASVSPSSVLEDSGAGLVYTFTRNGIIATPLTVNFSVGGGADFATSDYSQIGADTFSNTAGTVTFAAGSATATVTLTPVADTTVEPDETAVLTVTAGSNYTAVAPAATGTIANDDTEVSVAVAPDSVLEAGGNLVYTFTRTGFTGVAQSVRFQITGGALAGDYTQTGAAMFDGPGGFGIVDFGVGVTTKQVTVDPTDDGIEEGDDTVVFTVVTNLGQSYNVGSPSAATGTILNDDATVTVTVAPSATAEDDAGTLAYTFTRTGYLTPALTVNFQASGSATGFGAGVIDYSVSGGGAGSFFSGGPLGTGAGTMVFDAGQATEQVIVSPIPDATGEGDETVVFTLAASGVNYTAGTPAAATGTILEDDTVVSVAVAGSPALEGSGTLTYTFTRSIDNGADAPVNFTIAGTASFLGADYQANSAAAGFTFNGTTGTIIIPAGSTTASFTVTALNDDLVEGEQNVLIAVAPGAGYGIGAPASADGAIADADSATVAFTVASNSVGEDDAPLNVVARLSAAAGVTLESTIVFQVTATPGSALAADYDSFPKTVTFLATSGDGATDTTTLDPASDDLIEGDQTVTLGLAFQSGPATVTAAGIVAQLVTIQDADSATVDFTLAAQSAGEDGGSVLITARLNAAAGLTLEDQAEFSLIAALGTAQSDDFDFSSFPKTITFDAGDGDTATASASFVPSPDNLVEGDETALFTLAKLTGASTLTVAATGNTTHTVTIQDADSATVDFELMAQSVGEDAASPLDVVVRLNIPAGVTLQNDAVFSVTATPGSAAANDFDAFPKTVTFLATAGNGATVTTTLDPTSDLLVEGDETVTLGLSKTSGASSLTVAGNTTQAVTIQDADVATVEFVLASSSVGEDAAPLDVVVRLNTAAGVTLQNDATFNVTLDSLGDVEPEDFDEGAFAKTITFAADLTDGATQTITLDPASDTLIEGDETLTLGLAYVSGPATATVTASGNATHDVTINDADAATVEFTLASQSVGEEAASPLTIEVKINLGGNTLVNPASFNVTASALGSAEADDFDSGNFPKLVTFPITATDGATQSVDLDPTSDTAGEGNETLTLGLEKVSGDSSVTVTTTGNATQAVTILDDDVGTITGVVFLDVDGDGVRDESEQGLSNRLVFVDVDNDSSFDPGEPVDLTDATGAYSIPDVLAGTYTVRAKSYPRDVPTNPGGGRNVVLAGGQTLSNIDLGLRRDSVSIITPLAPNLFTDTSPTGAERIAEALYAALLGRPSDPGGKAYFVGRINSGAPMQAIVREILRTPEYTENQVRSYYRSFLGREADAGGLGFFSSQLRAGVSSSVVITGLLASDEYFARVGSNSNFVDSLYVQILGRDGDGDPGAAGWKAELQSGAKSRADAVRGFLDSLEARQRLLSAAYNAFYKRPSDAAGESYWLTTFLAPGKSPAEFVAEFLAAPEFRNRAIAANG